jgi:hypothetical protein
MGDRQPYADHYIANRYFTYTGMRPSLIGVVPADLRRRTPYPSRPWHTATTAMADPEARRWLGCVLSRSRHATFRSRLRPRLNARRRPVQGAGPGAVRLVFAGSRGEIIA